jgi:hypothetical protein
MASTDPAVGRPSPERSHPGDYWPAGEQLLGFGASSGVAAAFRSGLIGLRAILMDAADHDQGDPGIDAYRAVLGWLDRALSVDSGGPVPQADVTDRLTEDWRSFLRDLAGDNVMLSRLGTRTARRWALAAGDPDASRAGEWDSVQLALLRLPGGVARRFRAEIWRFLGHEPRATTWSEVLAPDGGDTILVAPVDGEGTGLRALTDAKPDREVLDSLSAQRGSEGELSVTAVELAGLCTAVLKVADIDAELWLCLESLQFSTCVQLTDEGRGRLRHEMMGRLREYARRPPGSAEALRALVAVDEVVHGVIHLPVAAAGSWWEGLSRCSRSLVEREAKAVRAIGHAVEVRPLILDYRSVRDDTGGNDVPVNVGGQPGDVLVCLRVYLAIDGQQRPGRVLYRASE